MQHSFWHDKWQTNQIGFHQACVNKILLKYWPSLNLAQNSSVLVPLCGKTLDLVWLRAQGHRVIGIELSEIALDKLAQSLEQSLNLTLTKTPASNGLTARYQGEGVLLLAGDFFSVTKEQVGKIDAVYDRAALVALPPEMRQAYCRHVQELSGQAPQLLLSFDYEQSLMAGPPFAVPAGEIHAYYQPYYQDFELLEARDIIEHEPKFKARGLSQFTQLVYHIS